MYFSGAANNVKLTQPSILYDIRPDAVVLGDRAYKYSAFKLDLQAVGFRSYVRGEKGFQYHYVLSFDWPKEIVAEGKLRLFSYPQRKELLSFDLNSESMAEWRESREVLLSGKYVNDEVKNTSLIGVESRFLKSRFGRFPLDYQDYMALAKKMYFCIEDEVKGRKVQLCSPPTVQLDNEVERRDFLTKEQIVVKVNGEYKDKSGQLEFDSKLKHIEMRAQNGWKLILMGEPITPTLDHVVQEGEEYFIEGRSSPIPATSEAINPPNQFLAFFGWIDTISPQYPTWRLRWVGGRPRIPAYPFASELVSYKLDFDRLPSASNNLCVRAPEATYLKQLKISGECEGDCNLLKGEGVSELTKNASGKDFSIQAELKKTAEPNRLEILIEDGESKFSAERNVFRAASTEMSLRSSAVVDIEGNFSYLTEGQINQWFERVLGWENPIFSKQRWGISFNYFTAVNGVQIVKGGERIDWLTYSASLKYRFVPGTWGYQETVGFILDYMNQTIGEKQVPQLGLGLYWAKSLPYLFDWWLNLIPVFRYPKWVDMDFVYYPTSLDDRYQLNPNWRLNFHGKIMWRPDVFGELGFGIRRIDVIDLNLENGQVLGVFYATAGLGYQF